MMDCRNEIITKHYGNERLEGQVIEDLSNLIGAIANGKDNKIEEYIAVAQNSLERLVELDRIDKFRVKRFKEYNITKELQKINKEKLSNLLRERIIN